jgi:16S rRNA (guanine527-N7)-methyltransferase
VFHVKHDDLVSAAGGLGLALDAAAADRLSRYEDLLRSVAIRRGFISPADAPVLESRHVLDSLRAAPLVRGAVVDIGSGAGLPGIPVAIARQDVTVDLVEPRRLRLAFLELSVERLGLENVRPVPRRAEEIRGPYDVVLARAFASVRESWAAAERILAEGGSLVYFAGAGFDPASLDGLRATSRLVAPPPALASGGALVIMTRQ